MQSEECLTVDRIVLDAIFILPLRTGDGKPCAGRTIQWENGTRTILRRLVEDEVQGTRTRRRWKRVENFEAPVGNRRIRQKQWADRSEVTGVCA